NIEQNAESSVNEVVSTHNSVEATNEIDAIPDKQFKGYVSVMVKNAQIKNPGTDQEVTTFFVRVAFAERPESALPGMSSAVSIAVATHDNVVSIPIQAVTSRERKKKERKSAPREGTMVAAAPGGATANASDAPPAAAATVKAKPVE